MVKAGHSIAPIQIYTKDPNPVKNDYKVVETDSFFRLASWTVELSLFLG